MLVLLELFDKSPPEAMVESMTEGTLIPTSEFHGFHVEMLILGDSVDQRRIFCLERGCLQTVVTTKLCAVDRECT